MSAITADQVSTAGEWVSGAIGWLLLLGLFLALVVPLIRPSKPAEEAAPEVTPARPVVKDNTIRAAGPDDGREVI